MEKSEMKGEDGNKTDINKTPNTLRPLIQHMQQRDKSTKSYHQ